MGERVPLIDTIKNKKRFAELPEGTLPGEKNPHPTGPEPVC